jgi:hypothetical protein
MSQNIVGTSAKCFLFYFIQIVEGGYDFGSCLFDIGLPINLLQGSAITLSVFLKTVSRTEELIVAKYRFHYDLQLLFGTFYIGTLLCF